MQRTLCASLPDDLMMQIMLDVRGTNLVHANMSHCVPLAGTCRGFARAFRSDAFWRPYYTANHNSIRKPANLQLPLDEEHAWSCMPNGLHAQDPESGICRYCGAQSTMVQGERQCRLCARSGDSLFIDRKTCTDEFMIPSRQFDGMRPKFTVINMNDRTVRYNCVPLSVAHGASSSRWGSLYALRGQRRARMLNK